MVICFMYQTVLKVSIHMGCQFNSTLTSLDAFVCLVFRGARISIRVLCHSLTQTLWRLCSWFLKPPHMSFLLALTCRQSFHLIKHSSNVSGIYQMSPDIFQMAQTFIKSMQSFLQRIFVLIFRLVIRHRVYGSGCHSVKNLVELSYVNPCRKSAVGEAYDHPWHLDIYKPNSTDF